MPAPGEWVLTCPYCSASPAPFQPQSERFKTGGRDGQLRYWIPAACPACGGVIIAELNPAGESIVETKPKFSGEWDVGHLPAPVQAIWDEAIKVYRVGAYASAVVACGRTLEAAADELKVSAKTLDARIQKMQADGLITQGFKGAMDYVRLIRNVGAHAGKEVSPESAEGTLRFTQQTLRLLFEVPGELARLTGHPPELAGDEAE